MIEMAYLFEKNIHKYIAYNMARILRKIYLFIVWRIETTKYVLDGI